MIDMDKEKSMGLYIKDIPCAAIQNRVIGYGDLLLAHGAARRTKLVDAIGRDDRKMNQGAASVYISSWK